MHNKSIIARSGDWKNRLYAGESPLAHIRGDITNFLSGPTGLLGRRWTFSSPIGSEFWYAFVFPLTAILLFTSFGIASAQALDPRGNLPPRDKLHFRLLDLLTLESTPALQEKGPIRIDKNGRVQVYIRTRLATPALLEQIGTLGGKIDGSGLGVIQAWAPISALEALAALPEVLYMYPPNYGHSNVGSVVTEGNEILEVNTARQQFGLTGQGVRIGVISDGLKGLEASIASGDLPSTTFHCRAQVIILRQNGCLLGEKLVETSGGIAGTSFRSDEDVAAGPEGTAMLEIIHDLAPEAELWFVNGATAVDVANGAIFLTANVDVVVSDLGFLAFFPDGQNTIAQNLTQIINKPGNRARAFFQSVGNYAEQHYSALYTDSGFGNDFGNYHLFSANSETTGPSTSFYSNEVRVPPLGSVEIFLSWNDPAGVASNDYDLLLVDCESEVLLDFSDEIQNGFQEPSEVVVYQNPFSVELAVCYVIQKYQAAPRMLNVIIAQPYSHQFNTHRHSLSAPADAFGDLLAVGAVSHSAPNQVESFSSQGPTFDNRLKPDLVATDGVAVTGAGGFGTPFSGTSASAPHAAAIAALIFEADPSLTFAQIRNSLTSTAIDLGTVGLDPVAGHGRINAFAAVNALVGMSANTAPTVNAGTSQIITLPNVAVLNGTMTDDGLPNPPGIVTTLWSKVSGPGSVSFTNPNLLNTTATFNKVGSYVLRLLTDDGLLQAFADVVITVTVATLGVPSLYDINADGKVDLVWRNTDTGDVGVWLGDGLALGPTGLLPRAPKPWVIIGMGDLSGDGKADMVWRNTSTGEVGGWLMDGLSAPTLGLIAGMVPVAWVIDGVGDLNGDGKADLVWRNTDTGDVAVWLMNGLTILSSGLLGRAPPNWLITGIGDLDGDGKDDLMWRNTDTGDVGVWLGDGLTLGSIGVIAAMVDPAWVIAGMGDLDGDGKDDLVWRNTDTGDVGVWLGDGLTLGLTGVIAAAVDLAWVIGGVGDLEGDGKDDLVWHNTDTGDVGVWLGDGLFVNTSGVIASGVPFEWKIQP